MTYLKRIGRLAVVALLLVYACRERSDTVAPAEPVSVRFDTLMQVSAVTEFGAEAQSVLLGGPVGKRFQYGHVWATDKPEPTVDDPRTLQTATGTVTYPLPIRSALTMLKPAQTYYVRPYVDEGGQVSYGPVRTFRTPGASLSQFEFMARVLTDSLRPKNIGYAFAIYERGTLRASGAGGLRSRRLDIGGERPFALDTRMHTASMSKTLTTVAFLRLAARQGIRTSDRIAPYLPPGWKLGPNIDRLTFRDLLRHRSGIVGLGKSCENGAFAENTYAGLKKLIEQGVQADKLGDYCYQNANFGLFRVLIPALLGYSFTGTDATDDLQTRQRYLTYVQQQVLEPAGVTGASASQTPGDPTYTYEYPSLNLPGWNPGDFAGTVGGYGWYMSVEEAGKLYATVLTTADESVLTAAWKDTLRVNGLGYFGGRVVDGAIRYHDGWWYSKTGSGIYQGLRTIWLALPNDILMVLYVNALHQTRGLFPSDDGRDIVPYLTRIYEQAWVFRGGRRPAGTTLQLDDPQPH